MFTKTIIVFVPAAFAAAVAPARSSTTFVGIFTHIGNDYVHLREINASGQRFYLNKATSTFCPKGSPKIDCSKYSNATVFASSSSGTLSMYAAVPGVQQVYVASGGALVTPSHTPVAFHQIPRLLPSITLLRKTRMRLGP